MTRKQWSDIFNLLCDWYGEICYECADLDVARSSVEIANEIEKILDN